MYGRLLFVFGFLAGLGFVGKSHAAALDPRQVFESYSAPPNLAENIVIQPNEAGQASQFSSKLKEDASTDSEPSANEKSNAKCELDSCGKSN